MNGITHHARCACGAVRIDVAGPLAPPDACHCSQCRRQSGHYWASTDIERERVTISGAEQLTWYASSAKVNRGFCRTCGSFLLWDVPGRSRLAIAMGAFDAPTGTRIEKHIFTAYKGDYYAIADGEPQE
jgi:hypothetical protein